MAENGLVNGMRVEADGVVVVVVVVVAVVVVVVIAVVEIDIASLYEK